MIFLFRPVLCSWGRISLLERHIPCRTQVIVLKVACTCLLCLVEGLRPAWLPSEISIFQDYYHHVRVAAQMSCQGKLWMFVVRLNSEGKTSSWRFWRFQMLSVANVFQEYYHHVSRITDITSGYVSDVCPGLTLMTEQLEIRTLFYYWNAHQQDKYIPTLLITSKDNKCQVRLYVRLGCLSS